MENVFKNLRKAGHSASVDRFFPEDRDLQSWVQPSRQFRRVRGRSQCKTSCAGRAPRATEAWMRRQSRRRAPQVPLSTSDFDDATDTPAGEVLSLNSLARDTILDTGAADRSPVWVSWSRLQGHCCASASFTRCGIWLLASLINHSCRPNASTSRM